MMLKMESVRSDKRTVLFNFLQKYLYELSQYYPREMEEDGHFNYRYFSDYFTDTDRYAYFICNNNKYVGFALINSFSYTGEPIDYCIAELTIFPCYRAKGFATQAVDMLMEKHKGCWQLKYSLDNLPAAKLWQAVKEKYNGVETSLPNRESAITFR